MKKNANNNSKNKITTQRKEIKKEISLYWS